MRPIDYLHAQMELEGIVVSDRNLITRAHAMVEDFPLVLQTLTCDEQEFIYFDETIPRALYHKLSTGDKQAFMIESAVDAFVSYGIKVKIAHFKTHIFPENLATAKAIDVKCFRQDDPKVAAFGFDGLADQVYAIEQDGKIVSACVSSRQNATSAESWVFTDPDQRGKGLAQQVVTAWAQGIRTGGMIPFYSHAADNTASAIVARKMNLHFLYDERVIERLA